MIEFRFKANIKHQGGTSESRRLRRAGKIPTIIYGKGLPPSSITIDHSELMNATGKDSFFESTLVIDIEGRNTEYVKIKSLQRHPYKPKILHADFLRT